MGQISASLRLSFCVSVSTSWCVSCLCSVFQPHLPRIRRPSPGFLSPDLALCRRRPLVPAGAHRARRPPAGPARRQDKEGGRRGQRRGAGRGGGGGPGAWETGARGTPLRPPCPSSALRLRGREAGGKCAEFLGVPQEEAGAEFAPALWTGEALPGGSPGGQVWRQRLWPPTPRAWRAVHATARCSCPHARSYSSWHPCAPLQPAGPGPGPLS